MGRSGELSDFVGETPSEPDVVGLRLRLDASLSGRRAFRSAASTSCSGSAGMVAVGSWKRSIGGGQRVDMEST